MTEAPPAVLLAVSDSDLSAAVDRVVAAVGARTARVGAPSRRGWQAAAAIVLDEPAALRIAREGMPRRDGVILIGPGSPTGQMWTTAVEIGARHICALPAQETDLMRHLAEAMEAGSPNLRSGRVVAVAAGRGGAGASVLSAALALVAGEALLVDVDHCGGGIDLLLGAESLPGLRWQDLRIHSGRIGWTAVRDVLPRRQGVAILSATRNFGEIAAEAVAAVIDAGRRGGTTVVCDIPRQLTPAAVCALERADLVVMVTTCDVRAVAAAAATAAALATVNPALGLIVRGPSPGGLHAREAAGAAGVPLLAAMRPEPSLAQRLEQGGLRLRTRSPLSLAARRILDTLQHAGSGRAA